ncbi:hypothetical protein BLA23254_06874 [Burkholderia lata]|uniref:Uncharacterized protein n=1 Tax=Burkholderia lata (strain ATCC 17760 / DSM 23089 / LMG 22485 / NCIMB 9086 / R18194 / 383) TaxID=482957 RepID=A0A6P2S9J9_BURL3|nr:hypothetical protein BLA23254_06874 [Burkholderia lata]
MNTLHVERRVTRKFVGAFQHLDAWDELGTVKHTPFRKVYSPARDDGADVSNGPVYVAFARLPAGVNAAEWRSAIEDSISTYGCAHEHDCCGCASRHARVTPYRSRVVRISVAVWYNC